MRAVSARLRASGTLIGIFYLLSFTLPAFAQTQNNNNFNSLEHTAAGPQLSKLTRRVPPRASPLPSTSREADPKNGTPTQAAQSTHQRGRTPNSPSARLPRGVLPNHPSAAVRSLVTNKPTPVEVTPDPTLVALAEAEVGLFPDLRGVRSRTSSRAEPLQPSSTQLHATGAPPTRQAVPTAALRFPEGDGHWLASLKLPNFGVRLDPRVLRYLKFYRDSERGRAIAEVWARRSGRYTPALKAYLARVGLPTDLAWLSLIESGHNPSIRSHAGALGLWQFMPGTARMYGLTVDRWVDERLDPERSTQAAARFLSDLYQRFGSWELAMAAYNMGYGGLSRAIRKYNTNDFWLLSSYEAGIPWETALYVPKITAIAIVMNNKDQFGLASTVPDAPESFDTILAEPGKSLDGIAAAAGISLAELKRYNPQLPATRTPPAVNGHSGWRVHLPFGLGKATEAKLARDAKAPALAHHTSRFGDTLANIASQQGISLNSITRLNPYDPDEALDVGSTIWLPKLGNGAGPIDPIISVPSAQFAYPTAKRLFYTVCAGDTLPAIANAFSVSQAELLLWNNVDASAKLQPGLVLQMFVDKQQPLAHVRHLSAEDVSVLATGSERFYDHHQTSRGRVRLVIRARQGDTLSRVGKRYGISASSMERINQKSRRQVLAAGEPVVVYVKGWRAAKGMDEPLQPGKAPLPAIEAARPELLPTPEPRVEAMTDTTTPLSTLTR